MKETSNIPIERADAGIHHCASVVLEDLREAKVCNLHYVINVHEKVERLDVSMKLVYKSAVNREREKFYHRYQRTMFLMWRYVMPFAPSVAMLTRNRQSSGASLERHAWRLPRERNSVR